MNYGCLDGKPVEWMHGSMERVWLDGWMTREMDDMMDGWVDRWLD